MYLGGNIMEDKQNYNEERFDSFLNKTIIFSSKAYFKKEMNTYDKEKTIINDENYRIFFEKIDIMNTLVDDIEVRIKLRAINKLKNILKEGFEDEE